MAFTCKACGRSDGRYGCTPKVCGAQRRLQAGIPLDTKPPRARAMFAVGIDPGPTKCGWAILERSAGRRPFLFQRGISSTANMGPIVDEWLCGPHVGSLHLDPSRVVVAIETPAGFVHEHARGAQLMATARVAGELVGNAKARGYRVVEYSAQKWRAAMLGGRGSPSDAEIKRACHLLIQRMPKRSNAHERDAMGVAFVALQGEA